MSDLSEALKRAEARLATMTPEERVRRYHLVLREELQRGIPKGPNIEALAAEVERAAREGPQGRPNLGSMTPEERDKYLFGTPSPDRSGEAIETPKSGSTEGKSRNSSKRTEHDPRYP